MKPEEMQMQIQTPETTKRIIERMQNMCVQMGKLLVIFTLKNILIKAQGGTSAFAELEKLKKALLYWSTGNSGAEKGGYYLIFNALDVGSNEWERIGTWAAPATLAEDSFATKIVDPITIIPQPNGDFLITQLRVANFKDPSPPA